MHIGGCALDMRKLTMFYLILVSIFDYSAHEERLGLILTIYSPAVTNRAVWNRSLSYFFQAAAALVSSRAGEGLVNRPFSLIAARFSAT